jgi:hypothetical protein
MTENKVLRLLYLHFFPDGSGDDDDTFIDLEANITTLYKNITNTNATLDETFIDIDEPIPTDTVVDIDITDSKESSIDIGKELSSVDIKADIVNETAKVSPIDVDISKPNNNISDSEIQKQTTESPKSSTGKVLTKQASKFEIKTTPVSNFVDTDDEDIAQGFIYLLSILSRILELNLGQLNYDKNYITNNTVNNCLFEDTNQNWL